MIKAKRLILFFIFCIMIMGQLLLAQVEIQLLPNDPWIRQSYGIAVDIYGDTAIIGANYDDPNEDNTCNGSVYFHNWNGISWEETQKIEWDGVVGVTDAGFGYDVALHDSIALITSPWDFTGTIVTGAVSYYHFNNGKWEFGQKLKPSNDGGYDDFGMSVDFDEEVMVVGAPGTDLVVNTTEPDEMNYGAAYIFRWNGTEWIEEQMLRASDGTSFDFFGSRVAIDGDVAVIGAYAGALHDSSDIHAAGPGQVYVFRYNGTKWVEEQILTAADGAKDDKFGMTVAIQEEQILVGAACEDNEKGDDAGAVYYYSYNGTQWVQQQKIIPAEGADGDNFGYSIDIEGEKAVIGSAYWAPTPAEGSAYIYTWNGTVWEETQRLTHTDPGWGDDFGTSVGISGDRVIAGAPWRENGSIIAAGAVYVFHYEAMAPVAVAGEDIVAVENTQVILDGTGSFDFEGDKITYLWTAPEGITLSDPAANMPTFMAPDLEVGEFSREYAFSLVVNDGGLDSKPDTVMVKIVNENLQAVADAGEDQRVMEGTLVTLDGSASSDPEGEDLTYLWTAPEGIELSDATSANPTFMAPDVAETTEFTLSLVVNDGAFDSEPDEVVIKVLAILPVENLTINAETLLLSWDKPGPVAREFRYDDGIVTDGLGADTETAMCGAVHLYDALVEDVSWYLLSDVSPHETVTVAIMGLTESGMPDAENILYLEEDVPNVDDIWNTLTLAEPVKAPNGFFVGISSPVYLGLGMDDGVGEPYEYIPGSHWLTLDWHDNSGWANPEDVGFPRNFMIRANGYIYENAIRRYDGQLASNNDNTAEIAAGFSSFSLDAPVHTVNSSDISHRFFTNTYNVYLDGELIEQEYTDTEIQLSGLTNGQTYTVGVTAVYDEGESEIREATFTYIEELLVAPANVSVDNVEGTISWDAPARGLTGYVVYLDSTVVETLDPSVLEYTYEGLVHGETYTAGVSALYDGGESEVVSVEFEYAGTAAGDDMPTVTALNGNYPNPFNPETNISYSVKEASDVTIEIYNIKGQKVRTLVNEHQDAGYQKVTWYGKDDSGKAVASGIYFYKMKAGRYTSTRKMVLMK